MKLDRIQTGVRLSSETLEKITKIAKINKRSMNAQVEFVIEKFIEEYEKENGALE